jgi:protein-tyrosine-phosphatase
MKDEMTKRRGRVATPIRLAARAAGAISTAGITTRVRPRGVPLRGVLGLAPKHHRPRLVVFVGNKTTPAASLAVLWFAALAAETKASVVLACVDGAPILPPELVAATMECGLDARRLIARTLTPELIAAADLIVTISAGRRSAGRLLKTARRKEHWTVVDAAVERRKKAGGAAARGTKARTRANRLAITQDAILDGRKLRDSLRARVAMLVFSEGWGRPEISREEARVTPARPASPSHALPAPIAAVRPPRLFPPPWYARPALNAPP